MPEMVKLQTKVTTTRNLLDKMKSQLALALPKHLTADRLVRVVMTECLASVQRARPGAPTSWIARRNRSRPPSSRPHRSGYEPGPLDQVHLIPRRNTRRGTIECTFQIGYRGLMVLVRRSGQILTVDPVIVYARDRYEVRQGTTPGIRHEPYRPTDDPEDSAGPSVAFYAVATIRGGGTQFRHMWRSDVERHRDRFAAARGTGTPWDDHFDAMGLKTVLKALCKYLPVSVETTIAIALDDAAEMGLPTDLDFIPGLTDTPPVDDAPPTDGAPAPDPSSSDTPRMDAAVEARRRRAAPDAAPADPEGPAPDPGSRRPSGSCCRGLNTCRRHVRRGTASRGIETRRRQQCPRLDADPESVWGNHINAFGAEVAVARAVNWYIAPTEYRHGAVDIGNVIEVQIHGPRHRAVVAPRPDARRCRVFFGDGRHPHVCRAWMDMGTGRQTRRILERTTTRAPVLRRPPGRVARRDVVPARSATPSGGVTEGDALVVLLPDYRCSTR